MNIKLEKHPRYQGAGDEGSIIYLIVNGWRIGTYIGGVKKKYENPEEWAQEMIPKRVKVLDRNIKRLYKEVDRFEKERASLMYEL